MERQKVSKGSLARNERNPEDLLRSLTLGVEKSVLRMSGRSKEETMKVILYVFVALMMVGVFMKLFI